MDWCKFFADIQRNPDAITPPITVRQLQEAREHVRECTTCWAITEKVVKENEEPEFPERSKN